MKRFSFLPMFVFATDSALAGGAPHASDSIESILNPVDGEMTLVAPVVETPVVVPVVPVVETVVAPVLPVAPVVVTAPVETKRRIVKDKIKAKKTPKVAKPKVGRPAVYTGPVVTEIVRIAKGHGLTGAMRILKARAGSKLAANRNEKIIPAALKTISMPTIKKFAEKAKVTFVMGRPKSDAA